MSHVDLTPVVQAFAVLLSAVLTAATPFVVPLLRHYLHVQLTATQAQTVTEACKRGAAVAYKMLVDNEAATSNVPMRNAALAAGVAYVVGRVPDALQAFGLTPDKVGSIVDAEFGKLLAADAGITVGSGATAAPEKATAVAPAAAPIPVVAIGGHPGTVAQVASAIGLVLAMGLALSACSSSGSSSTIATPPAPQTPLQAVYELEIGYAAALQVVADYGALPVCASGGPVLCHSASVLATAQSDSDAAWNAIGAARNLANAGNDASAALAAAQTALLALTDLTTTLKVN